MTPVVPAALALFASACGFTADWGGTTFRCNADRDCPSGFTCGDDSLCHDEQGGGRDGGAVNGDGGVPAGGCGAPGVLGPAFGASVWDEAWGDVAWSTAGDELTATLESGVGEIVQGGYEPIRELYLADGDAMWLSVVGLQADGEVTARLLVWVEDRAIAVGVTEGDLTVHEVVDGGATTSRYQGAYDPAEHLYWRVARAGDDLVASVSGDGADWDELVTRPITDPVERVVVRLEIFAHGPPDLVEDRTLVFGDLSATPTRRCRVDELTDDFDDPERQRVWATYDYSDGACASSQADGALRFTASASEGECGYRSRVGFDANDSALVVELPAPGGDTAPGAEMALVGGEGEVYSMRVSGSPRELELFRPEQLVAGVPFDEDFRWLRMRHAGDTLHYETSADGVAWDEVTSLGDVSLPRDAAVYLNAQGGTGEIAFDNLNLLPSE